MCIRDSPNCFFFPRVLVEKLRYNLLKFCTGFKFCIFGTHFINLNNDCMNNHAVAMHVIDQKNNAISSLHISRARDVTTQVYASPLRGFEARGCMMHPVFWGAWMLVPSILDPSHSVTQAQDSELILSNEALQQIKTKWQLKLSIRLQTDLIDSCQPHWIFYE